MGQAHPRICCQS